MWPIGLLGEVMWKTQVKSLGAVATNARGTGPGRRHGCQDQLYHGWLCGCGQIAEPF